jgi:putative glutamine amidotransferase
MAHQFPIIGIPCRSDTSGTYPGRPINAQNNAYINAVIQAGGVPTLIPVEVTGGLLEKLFDRIDGLVFTGGGDIDPTYYHETVQVDNIDHIQRQRDELELTLMRRAMDTAKPFLAICRGMQVMNVARGGTLWQDLTRQKPDAARHDYYYDELRFPRNYIAHEVILDDSSLLTRILETSRVAVNSLHHQGLKDIPDSLKASGYADDGLVEVLEAPDHPFGLGVQWHPEELVPQHTSACKLFEAFIEAASNNNEGGGRPT